MEKISDLAQNLPRAALRLDSKIPQHFLLVSGSLHLQSKQSWTEEAPLAWKDAHGHSFSPTSLWSRWREHLTHSPGGKNCIHSFPVFGVYKSHAELIAKILLVLSPELFLGSFFCSVLTAIALVEALSTSCLSFLPELPQTLLHGISREMVLKCKSGPWPCGSVCWSIVS